VVAVGTEREVEPLKSPANKCQRLV
jgi:hypothetical protein